MELQGISLTEVDGQVFLRHVPDNTRPQVDAAMLHGLLARQGYSDWALQDGVIATALRDCNTRKDPFVLQVAQRRDAAICVQISSDDMMVQVNIAAPRGGKSATPADVIQALLDAGVVFGVDQAALAMACAQGEINDFMVASGVAAQDGLNTAFESLVSLVPDRAPKVNENGLIDYREQGVITVVKLGDPLMRRIPPTPGVVGQTVRGLALVPRPGVLQAFAPDLAGTQLDSEDPDVLQAAITGQPVRAARGVRVEPVLQVKSVDMSTGHIYFDGTVEIAGEVVQGMKVHASGDIVVTGTVDGGLLDAGGDIHVRGGVIAHAELRAQGAVTARFAEHATLHAGTTIAIDDMALQCDLYARNQILVGTKFPHRGRLNGGSASADMLLKVPFLGSDKGGTTVVPWRCGHRRWASGLSWSTSRRLCARPGLWWAREWKAQSIY